MRAGESTVLILWAVCFNFTAANPQRFKATWHPPRTIALVPRPEGGEAGPGADP
jgi:hypothetical protein